MSTASPTTRSRAICRSGTASKKRVGYFFLQVLTSPFILNILGGPQKYRLHTRRPNSAAAAVQSGGTSVVAPPAAPQFVVVGGIWVPPPEYAAAVAVAAAAAAQQQQVHLAGDASGTTTTAADKVYAPVATTLTPAPRPRPRPRPERQSSSCSGARRSGDACSGSPAVLSSSSHTASA
jgi:hypothetical protein